MSRLTRFGFGLLLAALVLLCGPPALAVCQVPGSFTTIGAQYTYIYTPGVDLATSPIQTSITQQFDGAFWMLGSGDPALGFGNDNGKWPALEGCQPSSTGWIDVYPGYPAYIISSWSQDSRVDGCVPYSPSPSCMVLVLADQTVNTTGSFDRGIGWFQVLSARGYGSFDFSQSAQIPIHLQEMEPPRITGLFQTGVRRFTFNMQAPELDGPYPYYLDGDCDEGIVLGYKIYQQFVPGNGYPPVDRTRDDLDPTTGWEVADGGAGPNGEPLPLDQNTSLDVLYPADNSFVYFAASLVFESGFETPYVSRNSVGQGCHNCGVSFCYTDADCDDGIDCTVDRCPLGIPDVFLGTCEFLPNNSLCPDSPPCKQGACDVDAGRCVAVDTCESCPESKRVCGPATACARGADCQAAGPAVKIDTDEVACYEGPFQRLFRCPPGQSIWIKTQPCESCPVECPIDDEPAECGDNVFGWACQ